MLSIIRNLFLSEPIHQPKPDDFVVADFPKLAVVIPSAACRLDLSLKLDFFDANPNADNLLAGNWLGGRLPERFFDNQFDGLETFALFGVVTVANAEQALSILADQTFCPWLTRF